MKFDYEDLSDAQFETLVVFLCQRLLGISVQGFAKGPDGGRDAKFVGTAELHPSRAAPWVGTTIVQAKHTSGYNRSFSESDFFSTTAQNTVLGKEIPRVKKLRENKQIDHCPKPVRSAWVARPNYRDAFACHAITRRRIRRRYNSTTKGVRTSALYSAVYFSSVCRSASFHSSLRSVM